MHSAFLFACFIDRDETKNTRKCSKKLSMPAQGLKYIDMSRFTFPKKSRLMLLLLLLFCVQNHLDQGKL